MSLAVEFLGFPVSLKPPKVAFGLIHLLSSEEMLNYKDVRSMIL